MILVTELAKISKFDGVAHRLREKIIIDELTILQNKSGDV